MRARIAYVILILTFSLPGIVLAQNKFMAYQITGKVTYTLQNRQQTLKIGKVIPESATLQVGNNSSVILICEQASAPITFQKGTYKLTSYRNGCDPLSQSVTSNYFKYVWWQMTNPKGSAEDEKRMNMRNAGAVSRGCPGIDFLVPDTLNYYMEDILLRWKVYSPDVNREFVLYQDANSVIPVLVLPVRDNELHLDSLKKWMSPGTPYFWNITLDKNEVCPRKLIQYWDEENFREFMDSTSSQLIPGIEAAEQNYLTGFILEQNEFTGEAYKHYKLARKAKPGEARYKRTVSRFRKLFNEED